MCTAHAGLKSSRYETNLNTSVCYDSKSFCGCKIDSLCKVARSVCPDAIQLSPCNARDLCGTR